MRQIRSSISDQFRIFQTGGGVGAPNYIWPVVPFPKMCIKNTQREEVHIPGDPLISNVFIVQPKTPNYPILFHNKWGKLSTLKDIFCKEIRMYLETDDTPGSNANGCDTHRFIEECPIFFLHI